MSDFEDDNDYEAERLRTIASNRALLDSLGFDTNGSSRLNLAKPSASKSNTPASKKRKAPPVIRDNEPRRRSGRLAGLEVEGEELRVKLEEEEKGRQALRVVERKTRDQMMKLSEMVEDAEEGEKEDLERYLTAIGNLPDPRPLPDLKSTPSETYTDKDTLPTEIQRLKAQFKNMELKANAKVTQERVYSMVVHPEKTKTLVFVGDKHGMVGIWDALGPNEETPENDDNTSEAKEEESEGRIWHVQAHARNSIPCMKIDPVDGSGLFTSSYDCTLRHLDLRTLTSRELFALPNEDTLITHFDLTPSGQEAWLVDKDGGISHCDFREGGKRRRWIVQDLGRSAKLGGVSVNPLMPHLILTAGNDQHLRIWDTRHFLSNPQPLNISIPPPPPTAPLSPKVKPAPYPPTHITQEPTKRTLRNGDVKPTVSAGQDDVKTKVPDEEDTKPTLSDDRNISTPIQDVKTLRSRINTYPTNVTSFESISSYLSTTKGKGLLRANYQHGKSCSAAYWDPWGRRILSTSYDDKLRIWSLNPQSLLLDQPLPSTHFQPIKSYPHNCQTGRWLTILRAQWSLNMDFIPHFTVGNMKRSLDVITATGEKIVSLWADP
ncbi:WD-repeat protein [Tremella mesenterica]|uniref:DNA damage-binding protein CMR1 n=1 Tax=Tremella mesenterica TaxID=5217 RepID=A0A4Q1BNI9_TREME|nr:WD-repeat protein [Tremella mesenterica]